MVRGLTNLAVSINYFITINTKIVPLPIIVYKEEHGLFHIALQFWLFVAMRSISLVLTCYIKVILLIVKSNRNGDWQLLRHSIAFSLLSNGCCCAGNDWVVCIGWVIPVSISFVFPRSSNRKTGTATWTIYPLVQKWNINPSSFLFTMLYGEWVIQRAQKRLTVLTYEEYRWYGWKAKQISRENTTAILYNRPLC